MSATPASKRRRGVLAGLAGVNAVSAIAGGWGLASGGLRLDPRDLERIPFSSWRVPGLVLATGVGGTSLVAALAAIVASPGQARAAGLLAGATLVAWIAIQVSMIGLVSFLQPLYGALGLALVAASLRL